MHSTTKKPFDHLFFESLTDVGRRRKQNEDSFASVPELGLYVVCDGMGGHAGGEIASALAVETIVQYLREATGSLAGQSPNPAWLRDVIERAIVFASEVIFKKAEADSRYRGMGTTVTLMWFVEERCYIGHVGDSRAYLIRQHQALLLTEDHTLVNELFKLGRLTKEQTQDFPFKNALSRSLGLYPSVQVDILELDLLPGDRFVLCSDGLHGYFDPDLRSLDSFFTSNDEVHAIARKLLDYANGQGGKDNITAIVMQLPATQETLETQRSRQTMQTLQNLRLFRGLSYKEYVLLFNLSRPRECQPYEMIIGQGEPGEALFIIIEGEAVVMREGQELATLGPGDHFGEMSLIDQEPRSADVASRNSSHLIYLTREDFETLLLEEPVMGVKLLRNILRTLSKVVREQSTKLLKTQATDPNTMRDTLAIDSFAMMEGWNHDS